MGGKGSVVGGNSLQVGHLSISCTVELYTCLPPPLLAARCAPHCCLRMTPHTSEQLREDRSARRRGRGSVVTPLSKSAGRAIDISQPFSQKQACPAPAAG